MVEFAICVALFLLILFAILDFSRLGYNWVVTEKAMQRAVHLAALRPPMCAGVPLYHRRATGSADLYPAGTDCKSAGGICQQINVTCTMNQTTWDTTASATATEIWDAIGDLMPNGTTMANIRFSYNYDRNLGFIGGPYIPLITASLQGTSNECGTQTRRRSDGTTTTEDALCFEFITPLSALAATAGANNASSVPGAGGVAKIPFPAISVTLPAEDMNQGNRG